jgi:hypothetical protein
MIRKVLLLLFALAYFTPGFAQKPDTLIRKLDSLGKKTDSADKQINNTAPVAIMKRRSSHSNPISSC